MSEGRRLEPAVSDHVPQPPVAAPQWHLWGELKEEREGTAVGSNSKLCLLLLFGINSRLAAFYLFLPKSALSPSVFQYSLMANLKFSLFQCFKTFYQARHGGACQHLEATQMAGGSL